MALRSIMEEYLLDTMFDLPSLEGVEEVVSIAKLEDGPSHCSSYADRKEPQARSWLLKES